MEREELIMRFDRWISRIPISPTDAKIQEALPSWRQQRPSWWTGSGSIGVRVDEGRMSFSTQVDAAGMHGQSHVWDGVLFRMRVGFGASLRVSGTQGRENSRGGIRPR